MMPVPSDNLATKTMSAIVSEVIIRPCSGFAELETCVDIQGEVWGYEDRDIIPRRMFTVAQRIGGQLFAAFDPIAESAAATPDSMIGFAMALPALRNGEVYLHSHMLAVRSQWRNGGIGRTLKLAQRDEALARGIRKMEWTFDPLEAKNAYLNIARLGCIVRSYTPDFYGPSDASLRTGLLNDRMHPEWFLESERVRSAIAGEAPEAFKTVQTVTVPAELAAWRRSPAEVHRAVEVQAANREVFLRAFENGLAVVGFTRDAQGNGLYHLAAPPAVE